MPKASSHPINVLEKYAAESSLKPIGSNCLISNVVNAKWGEGYNFATADNRNMKESKILIPYVNLEFLKKEVSILICLAFEFKDTTSSIFQKYTL